MSNEEQQLLAMAACVMEVIKIDELTGKQGVAWFKGHVINLVQDVVS